MGLDYWNPDAPVNFRDVGEFVNAIAGCRVLPEGRLLRGGTIAHVVGHAAIGTAATIVSLRAGPDERRFPAEYRHFPTADNSETYDTSNPDVRRWLSDVLGSLAGPTAFPVYLHCTSGKDRTGVAVAALLLAVGVDSPVIVEEYLLSDGDVRRDWIVAALAGMTPPGRYFARVDLAALRRNIFGA